MSKFKLGLLFVFGIFILIGVVVFASSKSSNDTLSGNILMWGTVDQSMMDQYLNSFNFDKDRNVTMTYIRKNPDTFDIELAEALADGIGPDAILLPQDMLFKHKNKILFIPYTSYGARLYKDTFIEQSEIFLKNDGIVAIPFIIDPLIMYWNRDLFKNYSIIEPIRYWDEFLTLAPKITIKDGSGNISQTIVSLGEWKNISNAKAIISSILLQSGTSIVDKDGFVTLLQSYDRPLTPAVSALNFYTQFANPTNGTYSWNRSLPRSLDFFLSQNLATYFGFASELSSVRSKNPNLNFDIALIPQPRQNNSKVTFSKIYGISILKQSKNIPLAFTVINILTSKSNIEGLENFTNLPPIRRDLLSQIPTDSYKSIFYESAIFSKSWIDTDKKKTDEVFQTMIETITSGRSSVTDALNKANEAMNLIYRP